MEDWKVKIFFVKSAENDSNILMKNLSGELHKMHSKNMTVRNPNDFLILKRFEDKRKGVRDDLLPSNI